MTKQEIINKLLGERQNVLLSILNLIQFQEDILAPTEKDALNQAADLISQHNKLLIAGLQETT